MMKTIMVKMMLSGAFVAGLCACDVKYKLDDMQSSTNHMDKTTTEMNDNTKDMGKDIKGLGSDMKDMGKDIKDMGSDMKNMKKTTEGMSKNTDGMNSNLEEMKKTTEEMKKITQEVADKSDRLDKKTEELYDSLRQGDAANLRKTFLESMSASVEIPKKLGMATKYFWSFEFQLWSNQGLDDLARREELAASASREFLREVQEYSPEVKFISPTTEDNNEKNFLALATTMHMVNDKQVTRVENTKLEEYSIYHFFEVALKEKSMLDKNQITYSQLSRATTEILFFPERVIQLLQARANFIMAMYIDKGLGISTMGFIKKIAYAMGKDWTLDLKALNEVEVEKMREYLEGVAKTMRILNSSNIKIQLDKKIYTIFSNCKISNSKNFSAERGQREAELVKYYNEIMKQSNIEKM